MFNIIGGLSASLLWMLFVCISYARQTLRDVQGQIKTGITGAARVIDAEFSRHFPVMNDLLADAHAYNECLAAAESVAGQFRLKTLPGRIIVHGLSTGYRERFVDVATNLSSVGSFMNVDERRDLTRNLFESEQAYVVIMNGIHDIKNGPLAWHPAYIKFLREAAANEKARVSWIYIVNEPLRFTDDHRIANEADREAIEHIQNLGLDCFTVEKKDAGGDLNDRALIEFLNLGHMVEIFSKDFCDAFENNCEMRPNSIVAWKATGFRYRAGRELAPGLAQLLTEKDAEAKAKPHSESVWFTEEVAKLIRASARLVTDDPNTTKVLNYICKNSTPIPGGSAQKIERPAARSRNARPKRVHSGGSR